MIYLIEYERKTATLVQFKEFDANQRDEVWKECLDLEIELNAKGIQHEVVLLEAESKEALYKTHQRYFATVEEILKIPA
ncbi:MAG: hypothetical protein H6R05_1461 [Burkholderiaceae bacterium]|nr:hypothetical protein [Burkholderiaceae bacterium]